MGFDSNAQRSNRNQGQEASWKAAGFLNLYLPSRDGKRTKLGAIALRKSNARENQLFEALTKNPELVEAIIEKLEIEFRAAEQSEGSGFDLG